MPNITRCACGLAVQGDDSVDRHHCPQCGRALAASGLSGGASSASFSRPGPLIAQRPAVETIQLKPYYALEEPPTIGYRVVEVKDPTEASRSDRTADEAPPLAVASREQSRWSDMESSDLDVPAVLAKAKRELRSQLHRCRPWPLERNGGQCLYYPLRVWWRIFRLSFFWTVTLLVLAATLRGHEAVEAWLPRVPLFIVPFALLGVTWSFLRQVLRLAVAGDRERVPVSGLRDTRVAYCAVMAGTALLAGPVFLLAAALWFWVHAGALDRLDQLLLWQLWLCAGVSWTYILLAIDARGRLLDAQAKAVARLIRRQGWPALVFPILGGGSVAVFVYLSVQTWILSFERGFQAFMLQFLLWCAALFVWTFLLRWYGLSRYWREARQHVSVKEHGAGA
jgi:hypothetical protein